MFQTFDASPSQAATHQRIADLRLLLERSRLDAVLIPRSDEHQNEYVPAHSERLAFMTGFTGSAGLAVVAHKSAALFVDGRYTVQAPQEVDTRLFEIKGIRSSDLKPWLVANLKAGSRIGFDPKLHTIGEIEALRVQLAEAKLVLTARSKNLVDRVWGKSRPAQPAGPVLVHPQVHAGQSAADKIAAVQKVLREARQDAVVLSATDSVCWLFNIRGSDIAHNPVVLAHAIVPASGKPELFVALDKITPDARAHLAPLAKLKAPDALEASLAALKAGAKRVRLSPATANWWIYQAVGGARRVGRGADPVVEMKTIKNAAEIAGARAAHLRDGAAVTRFLAWLDSAVEAGGVDEITAVKTLEGFRVATGRLREISFPTISGSGPNGAIVHYRVSEATNRVLQKGELFLVDSGGQYADGTTDITRTVAIGKPTREMRERFTLVLKGMIAISLARFPRGTRGIDLDPLARRALWAAGLNYDHGTGHGVGSYLNVHEGPPSISKGGMVELKPGMILSNEPGYYKANAYGIRIENLVLVGEPETVGGDLPVMGFETLTLAPIDRRLVVADMLAPDERRWLDGYHARVKAALLPELDPATRRWLVQATAPLE
jgi:Xaa-Pro aminopeptidase